MDTMASYEKKIASYEIQQHRMVEIPVLEYFISQKSEHTEAISQYKVSENDRRTRQVVGVPCGTATSIAKEQLSCKVISCWNAPKTN